MDLEQFVSETLSQIVRGIIKAQAATTDTGARINPAGMSSSLSKKGDTAQLVIAPGVFSYVTDVQFDVAITATDEQQADAGAKIKVLALGIGAGGSVSYERSAVSRVQFQVPVAWPGHRDEDLENEIKAARAKATPPRRMRNTFVGR